MRKTKRKAKNTNNNKSKIVKRFNNINTMDTNNERKIGKRG